MDNFELGEGGFTIFVIVSNKCAIGLFEDGFIEIDREGGYFLAKNAYLVDRFLKLFDQQGDLQGNCQGERFGVLHELVLRRFSFDGFGGLCRRREFIREA